MIQRTISRRSFTRRHAFHILGLDRRGQLQPVRVGRHRIKIERGGITFEIGIFPEGTK